MKKNRSIQWIFNQYLCNRTFSNNSPLLFNTQLKKKEMEKKVYACDSQIHHVHHLMQLNSIFQFHTMPNRIVLFNFHQCKIYVVISSHRSLQLNLFLSKLHPDRVFFLFMFLFCLQFYLLAQKVAQFLRNLILTVFTSIIWLLVKIVWTFFNAVGI